MFLRPRSHDFRIIAFYVGKVMFGLGLMMLLPAAVAVLLAEWNALTALVIGASVAVMLGRFTELRFHSAEDLSWSQGMVVVALSWLIGPLLLAIPFFLSGHFDSYLDAVFDAMSGLTTSGLTVIQDLDHLSWSMNLFRHLTHFAGGQGIIIVVLTLFAAGGAKVGTMYVGEGRDERILPNIIRTSRFIYTVALVYGVVGTLALWGAAMLAGLAPGSAFLHAVSLFMAAFDTGGFSPNSTSIAYYHSLALELVLLVLMFAGALSFGLHYQLWRGDRRELFRNLETRTLVLTLTTLTGLVLLGLARAGTFDAAGPLWRKGFFTIVSAHTGTGFAVNAPQLFVTDWGILAPAAVVGAMGLGGMASSTAGGIKAIRLGLTWKGLVHDVRRVLLPESALNVTTYHSSRRRILRVPEVKAATTILILFLLSYLGGAMVGMFYGTWDISETLFESVSAGANVGLSVGITGPSMPELLQVVYILQMWLGRLEFMAVFALVGYVAAIVRGRT